MPAEIIPVEPDAVSTAVGRELIFLEVRFCLLEYLINI